MMCDDDGDSIGCMWLSDLSGEPSERDAEKNAYWDIFRRGEHPAFVEFSAVAI